MVASVGVEGGVVRSDGETVKQVGKNPAPTKLKGIGWQLDLSP